MWCPTGKKNTRKEERIAERTPHVPDIIYYRTAHVPGIIYYRNHAIKERAYALRRSNAIEERLVPSW